MKQPPAHLLPGFQPPPATSAWLCHGELSPLTAAAGALRALGASLASNNQAAGERQPCCSAPVARFTLLRLARGASLMWVISPGPSSTGPELPGCVL